MKFSRALTLAALFASTGARAADIGGAFAPDAAAPPAASVRTGPHDDRAPNPATGRRAPTPVPEPAPFALFGIAFAVFVVARRYARPRDD